jgi:hypothetical protein
MGRSPQRQNACAAGKGQNGLALCHFDFMAKLRIIHEAGTIQPQMDTDGHRWKSVIRELRELTQITFNRRNRRDCKGHVFVSFALFGPKHYFFLVGM